MRARCAVPLLLIVVLACNDTRVPADADAGSATNADVGSDAPDVAATYEMLQPGAGEPMSCGDGWCALTYLDRCGTYGKLYDSWSDLLVIGPGWRSPEGLRCEGFGSPDIATDFTVACVDGLCTGVDLRATDWRACSIDDECATVDNFCCRCEMGSPVPIYIGIRRDRGDEFRSLVCSPRDEDECPCIDAIRETLARTDEFSPAVCWHGTCRSADEIYLAERYGIPTEP